MSSTTTATPGDTDVDDADPIVDESVDTSVATDDATEQDNEKAPDRGQFRKRLTSRRSRRIGVVVLAIVAVAALAFGGWAGWQYKSERATDNAASAAQSVARDYAVTLTSVSADSIDQDFTAVLDGATGEFKSMYAKSSSQLRQLLVDNKAQAQGKVIASGVESASPTKVVVLLFVDQSVRNAGTPEPRIDRSRVEMTMELVDGRWLAAKVELP
ncbi:hypothetical protein AAFP30_23145 [Gordonia sp. CPCC 205515]|uniref:hypothetical protein n=1 Tax=Gordonia sp. CPCC 205515 TaxID=3140791 RepID=UPI003AF35A6D